MLWTRTDCRHWQRSPLACFAGSRFPDVDAVQCTRLSPGSPPALQPREKTGEVRNAAQEARPAEAEDAFARAEALPAKPGAARAREVALRAHMYQCMGEHARAVALVSKALAAGLGPTPVECLFLRGARPPLGRGLCPLPAFHCSA